MESLILSPSISPISITCPNYRIPKLFGLGRTSYHVSIKCTRLPCTNTSPWEKPLPATYAPNDDNEGNFFKGTTSIFDTLSSNKTDEASLTNIEQVTDTSNKPRPSQLQYFKWPMWVLGPALLLATGMALTLWLPTSSIFLGPQHSQPSLLDRT